MLTRDQILALDDLSREEVAIPEWGGSVYVRALSGFDLQKLAVMMREGEPSMGAVAALFAVDSAGARLFADADAEALSGKHYQARKRMTEAGRRFNALTEEGTDDAGKDSVPGEPAAI